MALLYLKFSNAISTTFFTMIYLHFILKLNSKQYLKLSRAYTDTEIFVLKFGQLLILHIDDYLLTGSKFNNYDVIMMLIF